MSAANPAGRYEPAWHTFEHVWPRHLRGERATEINMSRRCTFVVAAIRGYQRWLAPAFPPACRFFPSCSSYAVEALERHGLAQGLQLTFGRLLRCHPYHPGGPDPVPWAGGGGPERPNPTSGGV